MIELDTIQIGDRIKFRAVTRWSGAAVWRMVNGFYGELRRPTVRYGGHPNFIVENHEIIEIEKGKTDDKI
jgi:hypothetical protein